MNDNDIQAQLKLDLSQLEQQLNQLPALIKKALTSGNPQFVEQAKQGINQLQQSLNQLDSTVKATGSKSGITDSLSTAQKQLDTMSSKLKDLGNQGSKLDFGANAAKQVEQSLAAAAKQIPLLREGIAAFQAGQAGGASGGALGAGLGVAVSALGSTVGVLKSAFDELSQVAVKTSNSITDMGGSMDKLRNASQGVTYAKGDAANKGADLATWEKEQEQRFWGSIGNIADGLKNIFESTKDKDKDRLAALKKGSEGVQLYGDDYKQLQSLKKARQEMEQDLATQKEGIELGIARRTRDIALETEQTRLQFAQQREKIELSMSQESERYAMQKAKLEADSAFKTSEKKYQIERDAEKRNFQQKQADEKQDFENKKKDSLQELQNKQADKALSFANQEADKAQDFSISTKRRSEDAQEDLLGLQISGGSFSQYFMAARKAAKEQSRATEDYQIQKAREERNFSQDAYKDKRDYALNLSKENRDFSLKQSREGRDFGQSMADKAKTHELDVTQHYIELKQSEAELTLQHNQAIQSASLDLKQLGQNARLAEERLANEKADSDTDAKRSRLEFERTSSRQKQNLRNQEGDFAEKLYTDDPANFGDKLKGNHELVDWFNTGQDRVNAAKGERLTLDQVTGGQAAYQKAYQEELKRQKEKAISDSYTSNITQGIGGYGIAYSSFDTGGYIEKDQMAKIHKGEYIINPAKPDNLGLAMKALGSFNGPNLGNYLNTPQLQNIMQYLDAGNIQRQQAASHTFNHSYDLGDVHVNASSPVGQAVQVALMQFKNQELPRMIQNIVGSAIAQNNQNTYRSSSIG